jgi:hypothetical protein
VETPRASAPAGCWQKKVEAPAQFTRRVDTAFGHRRIVVVRDRPEDDAVGRSGLPQRRLRQGRAVRPQGRKTDRRVGERQAERHDAIDLAQHAEGRGRDLRPDAVAGENEEAERIRTLLVHHRSSVTAPGRMVL